MDVKEHWESLYSTKGDCLAVLDVSGAALRRAQNRLGESAKALTWIEADVAAGIATFALDGPAQCSGLPVRRYSSTALAIELGADFDLVESVPSLHRTPWGSTQSFQYSRLRRVH